MAELVKYTVGVGKEKIKVEMMPDAHPFAIALYAIEEACQKEKSPGALGLVISVKGGKYTGGNGSFVLTESVLKKLGRWA